MLTRGEADRNNQERSQQGVSIPCKRLRAIAYSMDALIPGLFIWFGPLKSASVVVKRKKPIQARSTVSLVWR